MKRLLCVLLPMLASAQQPSPPAVHPADARGARSTTTAFLTTIGIPGTPTPPDLDSLTVVYGRDSASLEFFLRDSSFTRRIPMHAGFPRLGQSFVGVELALERLRRMHMDSSTIALHPPSDPAGQMTLALVRFYAGDSAVVAGGIRLHVAADGSILGLRSGPRELRRVPAFEMSSIVDGFVNAFAQRVSPE